MRTQKLSRQAPIKTDTSMHFPYMFQGTTDLLDQEVDTGTPTIIFRARQLVRVSSLYL